MLNCSYCAGWGKVEQYDPYSRHPEDYIIITCPQCRGSGLTPDDCDDAFDALCNLPERELRLTLASRWKRAPRQWRCEMLIRFNNAFLLGSHVVKFELAWREGRTYLDVETDPHSIYGEHSYTEWTFLTAYEVPQEFDLEHFLNAFWREVRQGRPIDLSSLVSEIVREQTRA